MVNSSKQTKIKGCLMLVVLVAASLWLLSVLIFPGPYTSEFPRPFDSTAWKEHRSSVNGRCAMVADLRFRIGLKGKSRNEIESLLGPAENEDRASETSHWHLCPSFMDIWILEVRWNGDKVADDWVRDT